MLSFHLPWLTLPYCGLSLRGAVLTRSDSVRRKGGNPLVLVIGQYILCIVGVVLYIPCSGCGAVYTM